MSEQSITIKLRVTPELHQKIKNSAGEHMRSMNSEMVARLEQSFTDTYQAADLLGALLSAQELLKQNTEMLNEARVIINAYQELLNDKDETD